jgi:hypothetical protein
VRRNASEYRVIAVNVHPAGIDIADRLARTLQNEGWPRATRSLVVREALERLREELNGKTADDVFRFFVERRAKRAHRSTT